MASDLAARANEPTQFYASAAPGVACELYRESCYFSLSALVGKDDAASSYAELWDAADPSLLGEAAGSSEALGDLRSLFVERSFVDFSRASAAEQTRDVDRLRRLAHALLEHWERPEKAEEQANYARRLHLALTFVVLLMGLRAVWPPVSKWLSERNDLALGRPWRTSSEWARCTPEKRTCGSTTDTDIFFHTNEEQSPWFEVDLGTARELSRVSVRNRSDCCQERAVPLIVEISTDRNHWKEVARRKTEFQSWTAKFREQKARYVRLRVGKKSMLHLETVRVFP